MGRLELGLYLLVALAAAAWWGVRTGGGLTYNDSYQYLSIAENLRRAGTATTSIVHFDTERMQGALPAPATTFPPGYPALVAALSSTGLSAEWAGVLVSLLAFLAVGVMLWHAGRALGLGPVAQRLVLVAWVCNAHASEYAATVLTESLFTALATGAVLLLLPVERRDRSWGRLLPAALLVGVGYWIRYAGLFFAVAFCLYGLLGVLRDRARRLAWAASVALCCAVVGAGMARNLALTGSWRGGNTRLTWHPVVGRLRDLAVTQVSLVLGGISARPVFLAAAALLALAALLVAGRWASAALRRRARTGALGSAGLLALWVAVFAAATFYAALTTDVSLSARLFVPTLPLLLLLAGILSTAFGTVVPPPAPSARPAWAALPGVFLLGYLGTNLHAMALDERVPPHVEVARRLSAPAGDGRPLAAWIEANVPPDAVLLATDGQAAAHVLRRGTVSMVSGEYSSARWDDEDTRLQMARFGARYLLLFGRSVRRDGVDTPFLRRLAGGAAPGWLELAAENGEARVYRTVGSPGAGCAPSATGGGVPDVWVPALRAGENAGLADGLTRIGESQAPPPRPFRSACLAAARRESEGFQVVIRGGAGLTGLDVTASALSDGRGRSIPASRVRVHRQAYTTLRGHSTCTSTDSCGPGHRGANAYGNMTLGAGTYADGLVPLTRSDGSPNPQAVPFTVPSGKNQPLWVEIDVPPGRDEAPPGIYTGVLSVKSDQGTVRLPVTLTVWDFELPLSPTLRSLFTIGPANYENVACMEFLLKHKVMPQWLPPGNPRALARSFMDRYGLSSTEPRGFGGWKTTSYTAADFQRAAAPFPPDLPLYVYQVDEPPPGTGWYTGRVKENVQRMHQSGTRIQHLVTTYPQAGLLDDGLGQGRSAVDIWSPTTHSFLVHRNDRAFQAALAKGDQIWPYWGFAADTYSPRDCIDFPPLNNRQMVGFIAASVGVHGALLWQVDRWDNTPDPWRAPPFYRNSDGDTGYGDGAVVYPGKPVGVGDECFAPSLRMKWIRDGVEDFEYAQLARQAGVESWARLVRIAATDYRTWTKDPAVHAAARIALGRALHDRHP